MIQSPITVFSNSRSPFSFSTLILLHSDLLVLFLFGAHYIFLFFFYFFPLEITQLATFCPLLLSLLPCYFSANIPILFSSPSTLLLTGTFPFLAWSSGNKKIVKLKELVHLVNKLNCCCQLRYKHCIKFFCTHDIFFSAGFIANPKKEGMGSILHFRERLC